MAKQTQSVIADYDVLFAVRTGITILLPKIPVLECGVEVPVSFRMCPDNPRDLLIDAGGQTAILKDFKKDYIDEALERGFIMLYEMEEDEVIRCTPCNYKK